MPDSGGLQLLPETRRKIDVYIPGQNRRLLIAGSFAVLVALVWGVLYLWQRSVGKEIGKIDAQLKNIEAARQKTDEDKLIKLKESIAAAKPLLASHVIWSAAFERVQKLVLPQVQFDNLSVKLDKKEYVFKAFAASFVTVARQLAAFYADDAITDVAVGKLASRPDGRVEFDAKLTLDLDKINNPPANKK